MSSFLEPDLAPHYEAWKSNPNPKTTGTLLNALNPVIASAMKTYAGGSTSPTLKTKAKLIMLNSLKGYDPSRAKLKTHMMSQLQGLRRASAKESQILSIPEQVAIDLGKINESENVLKDKLGRDPSTAELADHTGLSLKRLAYVRTARPTYAESVITNIAGREGDDIYQPGVDTPETVGAWHDFVYHDLEPIDQVILEHTVGLHGKKVLSNQDIARRLRISPGAVSQRKQRIQSKLNQREDLDIL